MSWESLLTDANLIAYWNGDANDDGTGDANDVQGNHNGTWTGTETYGNPLSDSEGKSFVFDGASKIDSGSGTFGTATLFADAGQEWTVGCRCKIAVGEVGDLVSRSATITAADQNLRIINSTIALRGTRNDFASDLADGTEHLYVVTWDGTTAKEYLDGQFTRNLNVGAAAAEVTTLSIGAYNGGSGFPLTGSVGDVRVYDRALSASEVSTWESGPTADAVIRDAYRDVIRDAYREVAR